MASWCELKQELDRYNLTYVWSFNLYDDLTDFKSVQGYLIYHNVTPLPRGHLGRLPVAYLPLMSLSELEEFVVGCSVLSMSGHEG